MPILISTLFAPLWCTLSKKLWLLRALGEGARVPGTSTVLQPVASWRITGIEKFAMAVVGAWIALRVVNVDMAEQKLKEIGGQEEQQEEEEERGSSDQTTPSSSQKFEQSSQLTIEEDETDNSGVEEEEAVEQATVEGGVIAGGVDIGVVLDDAGYPIYFRQQQQEQLLNFSPSEIDELLLLNGAEFVLDNEQDGDADDDTVVVEEDQQAAQQLVKYHEGEFYVLEGNSGGDAFEQARLPDNDSGYYEQQQPSAVFGNSNGHGHGYYGGQLISDNSCDQVD